MHFQFLSMLIKDNAHIFQVQTGFKKALFLIITTSRFLSFQMCNVYEIGSLWFHQPLFSYFVSKFVSKSIQNQKMQPPSFYGFCETEIVTP